MKFQNIIKSRTDICQNLLVLITLIAVSFLAGCGEDNKEKVMSHRAKSSKDGCSIVLVVNSVEPGLADELEVELLATAPAGWSIEFVDSSEKFEGFTLLRPGEEKTVHDAEGKVVQKVYKTAYEPDLPGKYMLPSIGVKFYRDDKVVMLETEPVEVSVLSNIANIETAELKDIPGVVSLKKDYLILYVIGGLVLIILVAALIILGVVYLRKRARYRAICRPFFTALENLQKLESSGSIESGQDDIVCVRVSDILRTYIEERFDISASKCTTEEFLNEISGEKQLISSYSGMLREFLEKCDIVKFAKYDATEQECRDVLLSCRLFVLQTKRDEIVYKGEYGGLSGGGQE